jgi:membrane associated rhomboid family serine protease
MLPLKDDVPSQRWPLVTVALIAVNVLVSLYQLSLEASGDPLALRAAEDFVREFGLVPCRLSGQCLTSPELPRPALSIFTAMFLHGGLLHVGGNMLYLWIFGDNVEDELGHGRFLLFYLLSGVVAALAQTVVAAGSNVPMIGASGAVSGVLAAYLLLFPYARVLTLITFGFFIRFVYVPAVVVSRLMWKIGNGVLPAPERDRG